MIGYLNLVDIFYLCIIIGYLYFVNIFYRSIISCEIIVVDSFIMKWFYNI